MTNNIDHGAIPAATSELRRDLDLSTSQLGYLGSLVFLGLLVGKYISRQKVLIFFIFRVCVGNFDLEQVFLQVNLSSDIYRKRYRTSNILLRLKFPYLMLRQVHFWFMPNISNYLHTIICGHLWNQGHEAVLDVFDECVSTTRSHFWICLSRNNYRKILLECGFCLVRVDSCRLWSHDAVYSIYIYRRRSSCQSDQTREEKKT